MSLNGSRPPSFAVGEHVNGFYDPTNLQDARIDSFAQLWLGAVLFGVLRLVFTGVGIGYMLWNLAAKKKKYYLMAFDAAIETHFQAVERNSSREVSGRHPWRIVSQWHNPSSGVVRIFTARTCGSIPART